MKINYSDIQNLNKIPLKKMLKLISSYINKTIVIQITNEFYKTYPDYSQLLTCYDFHISNIEIQKAHINILGYNNNNISFCIEDIGDCYSSFNGDELFFKIQPLKNVFIYVNILIVQS